VSFLFLIDHLRLECAVLGDAVKLEQHLVLLREEYVKLQQRYKTLEKKYHILNVTTKPDPDSFVCRLLKTVADLFNQESYRY
jgi:rabankyrin-5